MFGLSCDKLADNTQATGYANHAEPGGLPFQSLKAAMTFSIRRPDDCHLHLRDGAMLEAVLPYTIARFARAVVMPNTNPPITTVADATAYRDRILAALPQDSAFRPLMTLYLTEQTTPETIATAAATDFVVGVKLYPAGVTTNSQDGITNWQTCWPTLEALAEYGMPLLVHGEVNDPKEDIFTREQAFIQRILGPLLDRLPDLRVVLEHVTTREGVSFVRQAGHRVVGTLTPHHLLYTRNDLFRDGFHPHLYCLPVLKHEHHRRALIEAALSGDPSFFLGTDSAPHPRSAKETENVRAGIFNAPAAIELYTEVFAEYDAIDHLERFASEFGARFYGLPLNDGRCHLQKESWTMPTAIAAGNDVIVPIRAGEKLAWKIVDGPA